MAASRPLSDGCRQGCDGILPLSNDDILARVERVDLAEHAATGEVHADRDQVVLVELADAAAHDRAAGAADVVREAEARPERVLRVRRLVLVVVPEAKVQRQIVVHPPLILDEPVRPGIFRVDLDVAQHDRETGRIGERVRRVERQVVLELERAVVVGTDALRPHHHLVVGEPCLQRVIAAAGDVGEGVLQRVVAAVGTAVRRGKAGLEVLVLVERADVELVAAVQADELQVVDPA